MSPDFIREALRQVRYPGFSRDIVSFGLVKDIQTTDTGVTVKIEIQTRDPDIPEKIFKDCHAILAGHAQGQPDTRLRRWGRGIRRGPDDADRRPQRLGEGRSHELRR